MTLTCTIFGGGATYPPARASTPARPLPPPPLLGASGSALGLAAIGTPGGGLESRAGGALLRRNMQTPIITQDLEPVKQDEIKPAIASW